MPMSQRKAASSFINDSGTEKNLIQLGPHINPHQLRKSDNISNNNQNSRTCFIGDSILANDIPRAFSVTKTGEKHLLDLDDTLTEKGSALNLYTINSPQCSKPVMEQISEKSLSQLMGKASKSSYRILKKAKSAKRFSSQKHRLPSTPRSGETKSLLIEKVNTKDMKIFSKNRSSETQTDENLYFIPGSFKPPESTQFNPSTYGYNIPLEGLKNYKKKTLQRQLNNLNYAIPAMPKPLKVYRRHEKNWTKYSELRTAASAFTLIILLLWLFLTFFEIDYFWDNFDNLWDYFQKWFLKKEKPKTKVEIFVQFLQDLWS